MKHRFFTIILAVLMLFSAISAFATETTEPTQPQRDPGYCGEAIMWSYAGGTLTITGAGAMDDFPNGAPWAEYKNEIRTVIISGGITYIGAYSFSDYDKLTSVSFGSAVAQIGERAFFSCDGLTSVYLPESFRIFGPGSFMGCTRLKEFHCEGPFPSFRLNCMWDTYAKIYYPAERPWKLEYIIEMEEQFHGRIEFLASDGTDPYGPTVPTINMGSPTEAPTEETTEPPTEAPTTEAPTTAPPTTEAPTETVTDPTTRETTEATTEAAVEDPATAPDFSFPLTGETGSSNAAAEENSGKEDASEGENLPATGLQPSGILISRIIGILAGIVILAILIPFIKAMRKKGKYAR